jgi:hypothetical protein
MFVFEGMDPAWSGRGGGCSNLGCRLDAQVLPRPQSLSKGGEENEKKFFQLGARRIMALPGNYITATDLYRLQLHCTALHCTALHCTALHCTALHCAQRRACGGGRVKCIITRRSSLLAPWQGPGCYNLGHNPWDHSSQYCKVNEKQMKNIKINGKYIYYQMWMTNVSVYFIK